MLDTSERRLSSNIAELSPCNEKLLRRLRSALSLENLEVAAQRILPRPLYSYIADGSERQALVRANRSCFEDWSFLLRILRDTTAWDQSVTLFGRRYDAPFGNSPMGGAALVGFEADLAFARAAAAVNIPMVLSAASLVPWRRFGSRGKL